MGAMKKTRRLFVLLVLGAMVVAYLLGSVTAPGAANGLFSRLSTSAITPQQWAAVQASNALLLDEQGYMVYLPLSLSD